MITQNTVERSRPASLAAGMVLGIAARFPANLASGMRNRRTSPAPLLVLCHADHVDMRYRYRLQGIVEVCRTVAQQPFGRLSHLLSGPAYFESRTPAAITTAPDTATCALCRLAGRCARRLGRSAGWRGVHAVPMSLMLTCTLKSRLTQTMLALPRLICAQIELSPYQPAAPTCSLPRGCSPPAGG